MLSAHHITVLRDTRPILSDLSLSLRAGEVTAILGPNGAGKTTLVQALAGLLPMQSGDVLLGQDSIPAMDPAVRARRIAWLPQGAEGHWPLSVWDTVALGRIPHRKRWSLLAGSRLSATDQAVMTKVLKDTAVLDLAQRRLHQLSGGERARVLLARALAVEAPVLLTDEPTAHLDPGQQVKIMGLLRQRAKAGDTVVVVLHDLHLARRHCDRLIMIHHGQIVGDGPPDAVLNETLLTQVFGPLNFT